MNPRTNDTIAVTTSFGSTRIVRVARDGSLFGADMAPLGESLSACRSWRYALVQERRDFDECLRDHLVPPPMSVVVRRQTLLATAAPPASPGLQARAWGRYSFVSADRRRAS